ncbi:MAG: deoxyribodipyrimidine photolyase [Ulvibacter sp.]|nr:deoxyribodipyrimidine photolyase [Ulvibacter sp.]|tara:strand:+ start:456 stop:1574 length:1119 start_codon:yes stop_codon:yes gene_type:complete
MNLAKDKEPTFPTSYKEILQRIDAIDPLKYRASRNYIDGAVSYLSPYISRGVISTKFIFTEILKKGHHPKQAEKFIQELAWRDYWQQVWIAKADAINHDIKHIQAPVSNTEVPKAILEATTGINAVDKAIEEFYKTGYLHNHLRMYIAAISCNMGRSHWKSPAKWMYYHLLDADWASNALSWQWVAGANANKKYVANQENINTYCFTNQKGTFLDIPYEGFTDMDVPEVLKQTSPFVLKTPLPNKQAISIDNSLPSCIYNMYNLDPLWKQEITANRILLLEPSCFDSYPVSQKTIDFIIDLAQQNIPNIQIYVGEFSSLQQQYGVSNTFFKEHPLNKHYKGIQDPREWMFDVQGYFPSFFGFWKKCKKQIIY